MIVTVTGGRNFNDAPLIKRALNALLAHSDRQLALLRHGDAAGADTLAARWAERVGVEVEAFPADWRRHGAMAGPFRNRRMLDAEPRCDLLVAFPGGRGTKGCIYEARRRGILVVHGHDLADLPKVR